MSKVSDAKKRQNYQGKPIRRRCRICKYFLSELGYLEEKNMRCVIGGFKVTPNDVCDMFEYKALE